MEGFLHGFLMLSGDKSPAPIILLAQCPANDTAQFLENLIGLPLATPAPSQPPPPVIGFPTGQGGQPTNDVSIEITTETGKSYTLRRSFDLSNWVEIAIFNGDGTVKMILDAGVLSSHTEAFYELYIE